MLCQDRDAEAHADADGGKTASMLKQQQIQDG